MITKEEAISYVKNLAELKILTSEELKSAYNSVLPENVDISTNKKLNITEILYYIGGGIVFIGIFIMIWQNWHDFSFLTKLLVILVSGIAAYFIGAVLNRREKTQGIGLAFHLIAAMVMPIGIYVVFDNAGLDIGSYGIQSLISGILFSVYLCSYFIFKKNFFILFSIIFGTWFYFAITGKIAVDAILRKDQWNFNWYRVLVAGVSYMLMGYSFSKNDKKPISGFLYGFGIFSFLLSALMLGGWEPSEFQNIFWELIYIGLVLGALFLSVKIKSKSFLVWGTIFLMAFIMKITSEYFSVGLGWPLALIIAGFAMIGVGYLGVSLKQKYINN